MEIDVTQFCQTAELAEISGSRAELGDDAGRITWNNAKASAASESPLTTKGQLRALREWARETGAWDAEEIAAWSAIECNALFLQMVAGDMREIEALCTRRNGEINWQKAERLAEEGTIGGNLYRGDDGRIWFYLGS